MRTIVWFRGKDLRLSDHAPLSEAISSGEVVPLFVIDPYFFDPARVARWPHRMQFLLDALAELESGLARRGSRLLVVAGRSVDVVPRLVRQWRADRLVAYRWVEPVGRERDRRIADAISVPFDRLEGETLRPPGALRTGAGKPYSVFTPFARAHGRGLTVGDPWPAPSSVPPLPRDIEVDTVPVPSLAALGLARNPALQVGGEAAAQARLDAFIDGPAARYDTGRDRLDLSATSRLSADLKFGTVSVRQVWTAIKSRLPRSPATEAFLNEIVWREFTHSTLWDRPEVLDGPFRREFNGFPWRDDEAGWSAWRDGRTGYPVVDASARQLLHEGFVHNRARMISASFLTKHLLIDYRLGEAHYLRYLTDGDWAQNNAGWQWSAGCGCDAQPYFRVFNPVTQGRRFDVDGDYVRRWVPELAALPTRHLHAPWDAPQAVLDAAGVRLGRDYPAPIVDHREGRQRFLDCAREHLRPPRP